MKVIKVWSTWNLQWVLPRKNSVWTLRRTTPRVGHQNMPHDLAFARVWKIGHQLERRNVGIQVEPLIMAHLDSIDEQDFQ